MTGDVYQSEVARLVRAEMAAAVRPLDMRDRTVLDLAQRVRDGAEVLSTVALSVMVDQDQPTEHVLVCAFGDVLAPLATLADVLGCSLSDVMKQSVEGWRARHRRRVAIPTEPTRGEAPATDGHAAPVTVSRIDPGVEVFTDDAIAHLRRVFDEAFGHLDRR
jgi:hypothetical protein